MPEPSQDDVLLAFFKALADESRMRLIGLLAARDRTGAELAELLGLSEPTVSHHLAVLDRAGLIGSRSEGVTRWRTLDRERIGALSRTFFDDAGLERLAPARPSYEDRVLSAFVAQDGTVTTIPASRRKRAVLLAKLAEDFAEDRPYAEAEVNAILVRRNPDCATVRRELVGHRMLERQAGIYRRLPRSEWRTETGARREAT